jgi:hypothetical protein
MWSWHANRICCLTNPSLNASLEVRHEQQTPESVACPTDAAAGPGTAPDSADSDTRPAAP